MLFILSNGICIKTLLQVNGHRVQADKLHDMTTMSEIVLEKERLRHVESFLEQQASYTRIGKARLARRPVCHGADSVFQTGSSVINHEAKRAISNTMTWMDHIDEEVIPCFGPLGFTSFTHFAHFR